MKDQTFLERIIIALGMKWWEVAKEIGIRSKDMKALMHSRATVADMEEDETWWRIAELIDTRIGLLIAAKRELADALQADRVKRAARLERFHSMPKRTPPERKR